MAIDDFEDLRCTGSFDSCEAALAALAGGDPPDAILLDLGLPGISGFEGIPRFRKLAPAVEIVVLTAFDDDEKLFAAIRAGASGYLLKTSSVEEIAAALRQVRAGGSPMTSRIARRVLAFFSTARPWRTDYGLTPREREVLERLIEGLAKKEIASRLGISLHTVDMHLRKVYVKLHVRSATGAVGKVLKERWL